jgi:hypothetical protein
MPERRPQEAVAAGVESYEVIIGGCLRGPRLATNGFARLLPGPYRLPPAFLYPQFVPLGLLFFWMIRARSTGWFTQNETPRELGRV